MSENLSSWSVAEYMLAIEPHEALREEINGVKRYFGEKYDCAQGVAGKPRITLCRFQQFEMIEGKILHRLELVSTAHDAFTVELHDFGSFPTHSIFINVTTKTNIIELVRSLRPMQQLMKIDKERKPHFITEPYINIARKLLPWQYEKGWLELSNTHFSGRFVVDKILLLRKREHDSGYIPLKKFSLLSRRESVDQGTLF